MKPDEILQLTPEQVNEAFLCLAGMMPHWALRPELKELDNQSWAALANCLVELEREKDASVLH